MIVLPQQPIVSQQTLLSPPINLPSIRHHIKQHRQQKEHNQQQIQQHIHQQHIQQQHNIQHQQYHPMYTQLQRRQPTMPSLLEKLPMELQDMVFRNVDYQSLIFMSMTNRHFNQTVKPREIADKSDMFQFVMRAANYFPQHRPKDQESKGSTRSKGAKGVRASRGSKASTSPNACKDSWGNFECYICYRVRSQDHFDALQSLTAYFDRKNRLVTGRAPGPGDVLYSLRRFCIDCGIKEGLHAPYDSLTTRRGDDLWVCLCRRVWSKPGCMRCKSCGADCPLRPKQRWSPY